MASPVERAGQAWPRLVGDRDEPSQHKTMKEALRDGDLDLARGCPRGGERTGVRISCPGRGPGDGPASGIPARTVEDVPVEATYAYKRYTKAAPEGGAVHDVQLAASPPSRETKVGAAGASLHGL